MNILCIWTLLVKLQKLLNCMDFIQKVFNNVHQIYTESLKSIKKCFLKLTCANLQQPSLKKLFQVYILPFLENV